MSTAYSTFEGFFIHGISKFSAWWWFIDATELVSGLTLIRILFQRRIYFYKLFENGLEEKMNFFSKRRFTSIFRCNARAVMQYPHSLIAIMAILMESNFVSRVKSGTVALQVFLELNVAKGNRFILQSDP